MKIKEELNANKEKVETVNKKLHKLTDQELEQVRGGEQFLTKEMLIKEKKRAYATEKKREYDEQLKKGEITKHEYDLLINALKQAVQKL